MEHKPNPMVMVKQTYLLTLERWSHEMPSIHDLREMIERGMEHTYGYAPYKTSFELKTFDD